MDKTNIAVTTYNKIANIYTDKYFEDVSDTPWIDTFIQYLPNGAKILDVGCGPGNFSKYLMDKGFIVEGIDLSKEMLKIARQKVPNGIFKLMDMRHLDYPDETFDGFLVAYSLIHIATDEISNTLNEFHRVLKPQGIIETFTQKGEPDKIVDEPLKPEKNMFVNFFTKEKLVQYFTNAGFELLYQEELDSIDPDSLSGRVIYTIGKKK